MRTVGELDGYDLAAMRRLSVATDAWFHVTRRNGHFGVYNHPMAAWSGVYCLTPGQHDADQPQSGHLSFINPHSTTTMYLDAGNAHLKSPFNRSNLGFSMIAGN